MTTKQKNTPDLSPNERLLKAMGLTEQDIKMNRAGKISRRQQRQHYRELALYGVVTGVFVLVVASAALVYGSSWESTIGPVTCFVIISVLIFLAVAGSLATRIHTKVVAGDVFPFTGCVRKYITPQIGKASSLALLIVIDYDARTERIFAVLDGSYQAYIEGETYTIYAASFAPNQILAAEHIPDAQM